MKALGIFLVCGSLYAQAGSLESDAAALWELAKVHGPEILLAQSERRAAEARLTQKRVLIPSNPEVEIGILRGRSETGVVLDHESSGPLTRERQSVRGYELSLSQEIETGGQAGLRTQIADADTLLFAAREQARRREVRFGLRFALLRVATLERLSETLSAQFASLRHVANLYRAGGLRDSRYGTYTPQAMESDLALIDVARNGVQNDRITAEAALFQMCGQRVSLNVSNYDARLESILPPAPALESLLAAARADSPYILEARQLVIRGRDESTLAGRSIFPAVTVFGGFGVERKGSIDPVLAVPPITSGPQGEYEKRIRFGVRLPIPLFERGQGRTEESKEGETQAQIKQHVLESQLLSRIETHVSRYETGRRNLERLQGMIAQAPGVYARLDTAFLGGRLSYSEYWGERSRWMEMERTYYDILEHAMESRMTVEILSGVDFKSGRIEESQQ
jgi:outer membrane protein TolC